MNIENNDYKIQNGVLVWVNPGLKSLNIPEGVTSIEYLVFRHRDLLEEITFPSSLKRIELLSGFNLSVKKVNLSEGLEEIGARAFENFSVLEEIKIPNIKGEILFGIINDTRDMTVCHLSFYLLTGGRLIGCGRKFMGLSRSPQTSFCSKPPKVEVFT